MFLRELQQYIDEELESIDSTDRKQRYLIHSTAFNKVLNIVDISLYSKRKCRVPFYLRLFRKCYGITIRKENDIIHVVHLTNAW
mgnify:CR=1 FL=1